MYNTVFDWFISQSCNHLSADAKGLQAVQEVEQLREKVYASLEEYTKNRYPEEPGMCNLNKTTELKMYRFTQLLILEK